LALVAKSAAARLSVSAFMARWLASTARSASRLMARAVSVSARWKKASGARFSSARPAPPEECQRWAVDEAGGRGRGGPATGAGEVSAARGLSAGLAGGVERNAAAGEAGGGALRHVRRREARLR
jgi:hypothetical protein